MPKPKPVGRPKLPKAHAKSSTILVRVNLTDRKLVETAAKAKGQKLSEWARDTLLKAATE
jgi:uncharacterized protein (DUF1778 family)